MTPIEILTTALYGSPASPTHKPSREGVFNAFNAFYTSIHADQLLTPEMFGAVGDGVVDDTQAFLDLSAEMTARGHGIVSLRPDAVYLVGKQVNGGGGYRKQGADILFAHNLSHFILNMNGAMIKFKGMEYGSFNSDGSVYSTMPNYDVSKLSTTGVQVRAENTDFVAVINGRFDGNGGAQILGGGWGDTAWQVVNYGLFIAECDNVFVEDCVGLNFASDAMAYRYNGLTSTSSIKPASFRNIHLSNCGRNVFSLTGGNGFQADDCTFVNPGRCAHASAPGGHISSSPASGFDVEAEASVVLDPKFNNCRFVQGPSGNTAFVTDSGTSSGHILDGCLIDGLGWFNKPNIVLNDCRINGKFAKLYGGDAMTATRLVRCKGDDNPLLGSPDPTGLFIDMGGSGLGVRYDDCVFTLTQTGLNLRGARGHGTYFIFTLTPTQLANQQAVVLLDDANVDISDFVFVDQLSGYTSSEGLFISTGNGTIDGQRIRNCKIVAGANYLLKWNSWSNGGGGYPRAGRTEGRFDAGETESFQAFRLQRERNFGGGENEWLTVDARSSAPSPTGRKGGSITHNITAGVGGIGAWFLDSGGTYRPLGIVGAIQATTVTDPTGGATVDTEARAAIAAVIDALQVAKLMA